MSGCFEELGKPAVADISRTSPTTPPFETHLPLSNTYYPLRFLRQRDGFRTTKHVNRSRMPSVPREREENLEEIDSVLLRSARPASRMAERTARTAANLFSSGAKRPGISVDSAPREFGRVSSIDSTIFEFSRSIFPPFSLEIERRPRLEIAAIPSYFPPFSISIRLTVGVVAQVKDFDCSRSPCGCKLEERGYLPPPCRLT